MSVIVRDEEGQIFLLCKGADRYVISYRRRYLKPLLSTNSEIFLIDTNLVISFKIFCFTA